MNTDSPTNNDSPPIQFDIRHLSVEDLARLGVSPSRWRDVVLAELSVIAAEADHVGFAREHLLLFRRLSAGAST